MTLDFWFYDDFYKNVFIIFERFVYFFQMEITQIDKIL